MADRQLLIPEVIRPEHRLGRHVRHDPRSLAYRARPRRAVTPRTVFHPRRIPILDQGQLGSCTCSSAAGVLGSAGLFETLPADLARRLADPRTAQQQAVAWYRTVTAEDPFPGTYEPDDTGSDGLTVAKVLHRAGLIAGYTHITSITEAHAAIQQRSFFLGTMWYSGLEAPNSQGIVTASGRPLGGHQYQCFGYEVERDLWWFWQTWGETFGVAPPVDAGPNGGAFAYSTVTLQRLLLREQGDATLFVPNTEPAPTPEPQQDLPGFPVDQVTPWLNGRVKYTKRERTAAAAVQRWLEQVTAP